MYSDYRYLNCFNQYTEDICPTIKYIYKLKKNLEKAFYETKDKNFYEKIINIQKHINFNELYKNIQTHYNDLKFTLREKIVETADSLKNTLTDGFDDLTYSQMISGDRESLSYQILTSSVLNRYNNDLITKTFIEHENLGLLFYKQKKEIRENRKKEKERKNQAIKI